MNSDQEMQAEAMDEAQDEILRLTEALAVEKGAHVETAKALVACREALRLYAECEDGCTCGDGWSHQAAMDALAATDAGDDYVSKASVKPIVEALAMCFGALETATYIDMEGDFIGEARCKHIATLTRQALDQAKLLGLV